MKKLLNLQPPADIEIKETSTRDIAIIGIDVVFFAVVGWVFFNERIVYTWILCYNTLQKSNKEYDVCKM